MINQLSIATLALALSAPVFAEKEFEDHNRMMDHGDGHLMDATGGMVMQHNLPHQSHPSYSNHQYFARRALYALEKLW
jgi:hypothetical protein